MSEIKAKKSLRDIFPENNHSDKPDEIVTNYYSSNASRGSRKAKGWSFKIGGLILVLLVVAGSGYGLSARFAKVVVEITPKQGRLLISNTYEATRGGQTGLKFVLASNLQDEATLPITTTGKEQVQEKTQGKIIVYNNYSTQSQPLVATTRFQTSSGLVFRTPVAITVPGTTKDSKGQTVPGQVEITVVADKAGPESNIGPSDFTIPGFKGGPKFDKFYARSKTALTGGFIGERGKVSEADKAKAEVDLKKLLTTQITQKLKPQIPDDYVLFDDAIILDFAESILPTADTPDKATIKLTANATGLLFNKEDLSQYLAKQQVPDYQDESVAITNWPQLKFTLQNKDDLNLGNLEKINFKLDGNGHLVWSFDENSLKNKLRLATNDNYQAIFDKDFPTIQTANLVFSPPWIRTIPTDESKIIIKIKTSEST